MWAILDTKTKKLVGSYKLVPTPNGPKKYKSVLETIPVCKTQILAWEEAGFYGAEIGRAKRDGLIPIRVSIVSESFSF